MIKRRTFPRTDADIVTIAGPVWNDLVAAVEYSQGLDVAAPLGLMQTPSGPLLTTRAQRAGVFPVKVVQVGGADGTATTPATWTYDVYALTGTASDAADAGQLLAEAQDIAPSRPNGKRNAGDLYGLAFYDGDTLILWDAGEYENTAEGCVT